MSAGLLLGFDTELTLRTALQRLRERQIGSLCTYTPMPMPDEPVYGAAARAPGSPLPLVILVAGLCGVAAGFGMQVYANSISYRLDIGGRPPFSWPAFVPIAFEIGVLCAVLAGVFGYFIVNRLPRLYEPIDELQAMQQAMRDGWLVAVRSDEPILLEQARIIAQQLRAVAIEDLPA